MALHHSLNPVTPHKTLWGYFRENLSTKVTNHSSYMYVQWFFLKSILSLYAQLSIYHSTPKENNDQNLSRLRIPFSNNTLIGLCSHYLGTQPKKHHFEVLILYQFLHYFVEDEIYDVKPHVMNLASKMRIPFGPALILPIYPRLRFYFWKFCRYIYLYLFMQYSFSVFHPIIFSCNSCI